MQQESFASASQVLGLEVVFKPALLLQGFWGGLIFACQELHLAFSSALEMILNKENGDGESHISGEMAKMLETQELMSLPPVCHTAR